MKILKSGVCALALMATGAIAAPAMAQQSAISLHAGSLEVPVNKSQVVTADRPILKAMIGNAEVADVLPISDRSVYVLGKQFGTTSLTLYDRNNRVIAVMDVAVGPDVDGLRRQIGQLIPGQPIEAQLSNGSVLLTGMVSDTGAAARAAQLAKAFAGDKVINLVTMGSSQQVMLEVKFAEIDRNLGEKLGVSGFGVSRGGSFGGALGANTGFTPGSSTRTTKATIGTGGTTVETTLESIAPQLLLGAISDSFGVFNKSFRLGNINIEGTLDLLERRGLSKTLAEPTLIALSGEKASFLAGGEFPIPVIDSNTSGDNDLGVEFKPFGVSLSFTPTVLGDKVISLIVEPEVSSIDPTASVTINGLVVPGLQTRRASTTIELRDGESFAIAGLLRRDFQTTVRQLPILGSLPIIGSLFRSSGFQKGETELLIVVTPRLVAPLRPEQVRLPTDRIEDPKAVDVLIDGEGYRPKALAPRPGGLPAERALPAAPPAGPPAAPPTATPAEDPPVAGLSPADGGEAKKEQGYEY